MTNWRLPPCSLTPDSCALTPGGSGSGLVHLVGATAGLALEGCELDGFTESVCDLYRNLHREVRYDQLSRFNGEVTRVTATTSSCGS